MIHLLRDLLNDPTLLDTPLVRRSTVEWEEGEWCPACQQYVSVLVMDICWTCLVSDAPDDTFL